MSLMSRLRQQGRSVLVPAGIGVVALVLAIVVVLGAVTGGGSAKSGEQQAATDRSAETPKVPVKHFAWRKAGFELDVPTDLERERKKGTARFTAADKTLVVTVGRAGEGRAAKSQSALLDNLKDSYAKVELGAAQKQRVDGKPALVQNGQAENAKGVRIRFVSVVVHSKKQNYAITAYTARDSDPAEVLPKVNAMVNSFEVLT